MLDYSVFAIHTLQNLISFIAFSWDADLHKSCCHEISTAFLSFFMTEIERTWTCYWKRFREHRQSEENTKCGEESVHSGF